jgi:tetratricopeptide (TPR) repeat protein
MRVRLGSTRVFGGAMLSSSLLVGSLALAGDAPRAPEPSDAPAAVDAALAATKSAEAKPADAKTAKTPDRSGKTPDRIDKTIDAFAKAIEGNAALDATKRQALLEAIASQRADADRRTTTITDVLSATHDDYRVALGALAEENITAGVAALEKLSKSDDKFMAADASFFLARAYMMDERAEASVPLLKKLTGELADRTLYSGEAQYLLGAGQAALLDRKAATDTLEKFLKEYPDAPERLRVGAMRIVEELKTLKDGTLVDIYDRMGFSRRKLQIEDSGNTTRKQQDKIVAMLDVLIKEAEDKEGCGT